MSTRSTFLGAVPALLSAAALPAFAQTPPTKITVGLLSSDGVKACLWAQHAGLFAKNGLEVETVLMPSGAASIAAVAGGTLQIAFVNTVSAVAAYAKGVHLTFIMPGGNYQPAQEYCLLFVKKDGPVKSARDLNGKTVSSPALKDINDLAILGWIDQNGGDSKTVHSIELRPAAALQAVADGRVDATVLQSPFLEQAEASGKMVALGKPYDAISKNFILSGWIASADAVATYGSAFARFATAMRTAIAYSNAHHADTVDLVAQLTKIDASVISHGVRIVDAEYFAPADLQSVIDFSVKYGNIEKPFNANDLISSYARRPGTKGASS